MFPVIVTVTVEVTGFGFWSDLIDPVFGIVPVASVFTVAWKLAVPDVLFDSVPIFHVIVFVLELYEHWLLGDQLPSI